MPERSNTKPRVAFLLNSLEFGGAQRVFIDDANAFVQTGYDVSFFVLYEGKTESALASELDQAVSLRTLNARSAQDMQALKKCIQEIKLRGITTLITTLNDGNRAGKWITLLSGMRIRLIEREANTLKSKTIIQKILDAIFFWVPYRIIAVSSEIQRSLQRLLPFSQNKIIFLPNAITMPHEFERSQNHPIFIFSVGRLTYQKNYALLVSALKSLDKEGIDFTATIVGEGILRNDLLKQVQDAHLENKISFPGHLPHDRVLSFYEKADVFVSTSRWEGSPNVVLEALSYGIPVVATKVGGVTDTINDGVEGLVVPSDELSGLVNALRKLSTDAALREKLGSAAKARIQKDFSTEARFARLRAIVESQ